MLQPGRTELSASERQLIEAEHARLETFLSELRETCCAFDDTKECQHCDREKIATCRGRLISFTYDFLDFVVEHFENEEKIMSKIFSALDPASVFHHHQEHIKLVRTIEGLMHALSDMSKQGHTAVAIREFHARATAMFDEHARTFDAALLQSREQEPQQIRRKTNA